VQTRWLGFFGDKFTVAIEIDSLLLLESTFNLKIQGKLSESVAQNL
jgi:hypothetical protein